jgi:Spy/CpxP family protein refolding chaperone
LLTSASAFAGGACCPAGAKAKATAAVKQECVVDGAVAKLNLTDEQKAKLTALKEECDKAGCTEASHTKMQEGIKAVLTPAQYSEFEAACKKADKASCPFMGGEKKTKS